MAPQAPPADVLPKKSETPQGTPATVLPPAPAGEHRRAPLEFSDVRRALVLGASGQGKSNLIRLLTLSAHSNRTLIVDPHREYVKGAVELASLSDLTEYLRGTNGRWRIAYHNDRLEEDFPALCDAVYELRSCWFIVDEASMFCSPSFIDRAFRRVADFGRHRHVSFAVASRRPAAEIHHVLTAGSWELFSFHFDEPADLKYLRDKAGREFAERVQALPPHRCAWVNLYDRTEPLQEFLPAKA